MTTPKNLSDFDPVAILQAIAADTTLAAGPRVAAARSLLLHGKKAGKAAPETKGGGPIDLAALKLIQGKRR